MVGPVRFQNVLAIITSELCLFFVSVFFPPFILQFYFFSPSPFPFPHPQTWRTGYGEIEQWLAVIQVCFLTPNLCWLDFNPNRTRSETTSIWFSTGSSAASNEPAKQQPSDNPSSADPPGGWPECVAEKPCRMCACSDPSVRWLSSIP